LSCEGPSSPYSAASLGREHAVATSLVSGDIAQVVALPFVDVRAGLNPTAESLPADTNITNCVGTSCVLTLSGVTIGTIPTTNTNTSDAPLVPHRSTVTIGIPYTVSTYPTTSTTPKLMTVTVVVTWKSPTGGTAKVVGQTQIAAP